ncbi:MAG: hypothetical protein ACFB0C_09185 [Leptolyngbyaceae cyanobacterium]
MTLPIATLIPFFRRGRCFEFRQSSWRSIQHGLGAGLVAITLAASGLPVRPVQAQTNLPPAPPEPYASNTLPGQQYLVYVSGNSPLLLDQVRLVEPQAFMTTLEGRSVIQAGRFNDWNNAQGLVNDLSNLGIGAQVQTTTAVSSPPPSAASPITTAATTDLPPLPVTAAPPAVDFGQSPGTPATAYPAPPATSVTTPAVSRSGYYVVVPGDQRSLSGLAQDITRSGAPSHLVQIRQSPRGPHVAVGPFSDRSVAEDWNRYLTDTGFSARVHYE